MKLKLLISGIALIYGLFFGLNTALPDGVIIIDRPIPTSMPLAIKYHRVKIDIDNQIAVTSIDQVFRNDYNVDLEGTYIFPLPEDSTITDFALYIDGKRVSGEILDKDRAREVYEDIVRRMKDPGLLEYVGRNMFKARIYPIPKNGESRVEITYSQTLNYDAGMIKYVYPLDTERFSKRPLEEVTISAKVKSNVPIKSIYSPSHEVDIKAEKFQAEIGYEALDVKPDKDFVFYYTVSEKDVGINLLSYRNPEQSGYFLMMLSPGQLESRSMPKDILFLLDTSGSMNGKKIEQAKDALRFCINELAEGDSFNVVSFATNVNPYKDTLVTVDDKIVKGALDFVDGLNARGGTNINDALLLSLRMFNDSRPGRPCMIVFLTDGEPTIGETNMNDILKNLEGANKSQVRIFVFGVGNDVNTHLLDRISEVHRGVSEYVVPQENIEIKVSSFYSKISEPILADINLNYGKIMVEELYPITLPDIFKGTQLVLLGRYEGSGMSAVTLNGHVNGKEKKFVYEANFPLEDKNHDFIPRLWATRKIGYLMSEIRLHGENRELVNEIIALSKEYGIITPYTSFLILENERDYEKWGISYELTPMTMASGKRYRAAMESEVGEEAVSSAQDIDSLKKSISAVKPTLKTVKHVGDKTFYLQNSIWVDSKYQESMKVKEIKYLSKKYFDILKNKPELGRYFSQARNIIVVFEGTCYRVTQ